MTTLTHGTLAIVLAGGEGKRLWPLSRNRAKPAIPIAGQYRLIDFALTNLVHSNLLRIHVLTQYQSFSLIRHLAHGWNFSSQLGQYCEVIPATSGEGRGWYQGSADAIFQNLPHIMDTRPKCVAIFGADHVYRMDVGQMLQEHNDSGADISVAVVPQPKEESYRFGCVEVDDRMRITRFLEKPQDPPTFPQDPTSCLASMGNYIFSGKVLHDIFCADHNAENSKHDIGGNIIPTWVDKCHVHAYNFKENRVPGEEAYENGYWRDVGTLESYWQTNMDLVSVSPIFNLYNQEWPILTSRQDVPPSKFVFADQESNRMGIATDSLVSNGSIISGGKIDRSILSPSVRINSFASVEESVLFERVNVGRRSELKRVIVDKGVTIPSDCKIGFDEEKDRARGIHVSETGIRVVPPDARL